MMEQFSHEVTSEDAELYEVFKTQSFSFNDEKGILLKNRGIKNKRFQVVEVTSSGHSVALEEPECLTFIHVVQGYGKFRSGNAEVALRSGESGLFLPGVRETRISPPSHAPFKALVVTSLKSEITSGLDLHPNETWESNGPLFAMSAPSQARLAATATGFFQHVLNASGSWPFIEKTPSYADSTKALSVEYLRMIVEELFGKESGGKSVKSQQFIANTAVEIVRDHGLKDLPVSKLADMVGVCVSSLYRALRIQIGLSPQELITRERLSFAHLMLGQNPSGISAVSLFGEQLIRLRMQDHYLEVVTDRGRQLVYMRFADAVARVQNIPGFVVHRSHWVAQSGITSVNKKGRATTIRTADGAQIPVSRRRLFVLEQAGLL